MTETAFDLKNLAARLKKVEKQNRRLRFFCLLLAILWMFGGFLGETISARILPGPQVAGLAGAAQAENLYRRLLIRQTLLKPLRRWKMP